MAAFITAAAMIDRVLGKSKNIRIPNRALLLLTGHSLPSADQLPRRNDPQTGPPKRNLAPRVGGG